jgi:hypothetical protein
MPIEPSNELKILWQQQPVEGLTIQMEELRKKANGFQKTIHRRNLREYAAILLVGFFFSTIAFTGGNPIVRVGAGLIIVGSLYVGYQLFRKGSAKPVPGELGVTTCLDFHRRALEQQYELLRNVWPWYLAPLVPGLAISLGGNALALPNKVASLAVFVVGGTAVALVFVGIARWNARAASRLLVEIESLNKLRAAS